MLWSGRPLYDLLRLAFYGTGRTFYASYDIRGLENVPEEGVPTLLCFNHGNSLGDPIVLIGSTPRVIRFCAKNTLWDMPIISTMVRMSGAVPVYRRQEHGDKAKDFNVETFRAVYKALDDGNCVGFAPEGVSSFRSYATKFKNGVGHIAVEAVARAVERGDDNYKVYILPAVMVFTHREKFRSDVLVRYLDPVIVDKSYLDKPRKDIANELIERVEQEFHENIISAPDWKVIQNALTAARIHRPHGTYMSLANYLLLLRGWVEVFKLGDDTVVDGDLTIGQVRDSLEKYQTLVNLAKIKDERIRRVERSGAAKPSLWGVGIRIIAYRALLCLILFTIALPGLLVWSPAVYLIKRKERNLLAKGIGWVDSVAESKMMFSFFFLWFVVIMVFIFSTSALFVPMVVGYFWLTMRLWEEAVASARSICGIYRICTISQDEFNVILKQRQETKKNVLRTIKLFPEKSALRILSESNDDVYVDKSDDDIGRPRWWTNFNPIRRRKKDWNELLRLQDHATMDYF